MKFELTKHNKTILVYTRTKRQAVIKGDVTYLREDKHSIAFKVPSVEGLKSKLSSLKEIVKGKAQLLNLGLNFCVSAATSI